MKFKDCKPREHEIVTLLRDDIKKVFGDHPFSISIDYGTATEEEADKNGLYFFIRSDPARIFYEKFQEIKRHQVITDVEEEFISRITQELIIGGMTLYHIQKLRAIDRGIEENYKQAFPIKVYPLWLN